MTIIVAQTPGGPNDIEARLYLGKMQGLLGQPFVLDFKPGAGSVMAATFPTRSSMVPPASESAVVPVVSSAGVRSPLATV